MGLAFLIKGESLQILSERKVLKEHEYSALLDAGAILDTAQEERTRILADAQREYARRSDAGFAEGIERGQREAALKAYSSALEAAQTLDSMKTVMAEIVVKAVRAMVGQIDPAALFGAALERIEPLVRDEPFLVVRVAPACVATMRDALARTWAARGHNDATRPVQVVGDATLAATACVVETPSGTIDGSLETQLDALREAIRRRPQAV